MHHRQRDSVADRRHKHCRGKSLPGRIKSIKNRHLSKAETQAGNQPPRVPEVHLHHKGWTGTGNLRVQLTSAHLLEKKTRFHQVRRVNRQAKLTELWYHVQRESCRKPVSYPQTVHTKTGKTLNPGLLEEIANLPRAAMRRTPGTKPYARNLLALCHFPGAAIQAHTGHKTG